MIDPVHLLMGGEATVNTGLPLKPGASWWGPSVRGRERARLVRRVFYPVERQLFSTADLLENLL